MDTNFWQAVYYYNPNVVYTWKTFAGDKKLKALGDEYMVNYAGVRAKLLNRFMHVANRSDQNNVRPK